MKQKPGVMIYFELAGVVEKLSDAEAGQLFRAILEYGATMEEPVISDRLVIVWPLIKQRIFTDDLRYQNKSLKNQYNIYLRWTQKRGETPLSYDEWLNENAEDSFCLPS